MAPGRSTPVAASSLFDWAMPFLAIGAPAPIRQSQESRTPTSHSAAIGELNCDRNRRLPAIRRVESLFQGDRASSSAVLWASGSTAGVSAHISGKGPRPGWSFSANGSARARNGAISMTVTVMSRDQAVA
jgi:hypothetical protein